MDCTAYINIIIAIYAVVGKWKWGLEFFIIQRILESRSSFSRLLHNKVILKEQNSSRINKNGLYSTRGILFIQYFYFTKHLLLGIRDCGIRTPSESDIEIITSYVLPWVMRPSTRVEQSQQESLVCLPTSLSCSSSSSTTSTPTLSHFGRDPNELMQEVMFHTNVNRLLTFELKSFSIGEINVHENAGSKLQAPKGYISDYNFFANEHRSQVVLENPSLTVCIFFRNLLIQNFWTQKNGSFSIKLCY